MLDQTMLSVMVIATALSLFWLLLFVKNRKKFQEIIAAVNNEDYPLADMFFIGFGFMEMFHIGMDTKKAHDKIHEMSELYGAKYAQYYYYVFRGAQFTYLITLPTVVLLLASLAGNALIALVGVLVSGLLVYDQNERLKQKLQERREEILYDFPNVLSKLTLLVNSGMIVKEAWIKIAYSGQRKIYMEMQNTIQEIENGVSEIDAYMNFADRCSIKEIRKFASMLIQNMQKGSSELVMFLKEMSEEMWESKKFQAKKRGDAAGSKLMIPMFMIFIGILVMIMVPMLSSMSI